MADNGLVDNEADSVQDNKSAISSEQLDEQNDVDRVTASNANYDSASESNHRCDRCDFEAVNKSTLKTHMTQAHPKEGGKGSKNNNGSVASSNSADVKMETTTASTTENNNTPPDRVHGRKLFECDVCYMKFSNGANMRRHKMRHTGVKPYECRVCQKRFFRKDHLAEHFTTHTKTLPYHCPICNRGFQRQIAMRAHFQNEHVGQHDLVKSCPLCSYRAGSMKSLRVHFFNRHGIDLDNPGPAGSSASLLAAAAQGYPLDSNALNSLNNLSTGLSVSVAANYSDSGDSTGARSTDNATPPMHFLTPHVEISMADAPPPVFSPNLSSQRSNMLQSGQSGGESSQQMNGDCPGSPQSADSNSNAPSSSHIQVNSLRMDQETNITPSISLIPIKQEPGEECYDTKKNGSMNHGSSPSSNIVQMQTATSSSLSSLIKVSPLKSLLREDLKRKISSRNSASARARATASPSSNPDISPNDTTATTTNGTITSTGPEQPSDSSGWRIGGKHSLSNMQCIFCGIAFPDQTLYFLHKGCHSDANPWKCNICGEQCSNVYEFNSHLLSKSHQ